MTSEKMIRVFAAIDPPLEVLRETENDILYDAGEFTAGSLNLIKSDLTPTGAVYTRLANFPLQGNRLQPSA